MAYQGYEKVLSGMTATASSSDQQQQQQPPSPSSPSLPQRGLSNQVRDGHDASQQNAMPSNQYIKQPLTSQGFNPINKTSGAQGRNGRTGEAAGLAGLSLMADQAQAEDLSINDTSSKSAEDSLSVHSTSSRSFFRSPLMRKRIADRSVTDKERTRRARPAGPAACTTTMTRAPLKQS